MENSLNSKNFPPELEMYFDPEIAERFAKREENEKYRSVSRVLEEVIFSYSYARGVHIADLGAGAHTENFSKIFQKLLNEGGMYDWVDISPCMLDLAKNRYLKLHPEREKMIHFIQKDLREYLEELPSLSLDIVIMKYTLDYFSREDLKKIFSLLGMKMKTEATCVATLSMIEPLLPGRTTNAQMVYQGKEIPAAETVQINDGDEFTIRFFIDPNEPELGYIAETKKFFVSPETLSQIIRDAFSSAGREFHEDDLFIGNWKDASVIKDRLTQGENFGDILDQNILVLRKKIG